MTFKDRGEAFLAKNKRLAIFGLSRSKPLPGNNIYDILKKQGYEVFAIHPEAAELNGDHAYQHINEIDGGVDAAFIITPSEQTLDCVKMCDDAGVKDAWLHYNALFGKANSSVSPEAVDYAHDHDMNLIDGGCPMMFFDIAHKCMRWTLGAFNQLPS